MSISAIGQHAAQAAATPPAPAPAPASSTSSKSSSSGSTSPHASYTVSISGAARAALAELTETSVQTAQEARGGDQQAQRLMTKEAAAKANG
ncbi:hypothetical protein [Paraburkholderia sp.]|uniref:hypothetical protein n=1 Tax=Paraburkholderia sp. TaxID=1926495 RepID=UPI003D6FF603